MTVAGEQSLATAFNARGYRAAVLIAAGLSVVVALMVRTVIDHAPQYDELLHFLAARSLLERGTPAIADGQYLRAIGFTRLVALSMHLFGVTLVAARIPAAVSAALLVVATSVFATRQAGWLAGLSAGLVLCAAPFTIDLAVFCRFYSLQALLILCAASACYAAIAPGRATPWKLGLALLAFGILAVAFHLQGTTAIAAVGMVAGAGAVSMFDHWLRVRAFVHRRWLALLIGAAVLSIAFALAPFARDLLHVLRAAPLWAHDFIDQPYYYVSVFAHRMPLIWPLFPVAIVIALRNQPRLTIFCSVVFVFAFVVHSLAAEKAVRYVYYAVPFLSIVYGCAISSVLAYALRPALASGEMPAAVRSTGFIMLIAGVMLVFSMEGQGMVKLVLRRADPVTALSYGGEPDWRVVLPTLQPLVTGADRVVTSNAMKSLYYFNRYDFELSASIVEETDTGAEFGMDRRTGRRVFGAPQSAARVLAMPGTTLVIMETRTVGDLGGASTATMAVITDRCAPVPLPREVPILAWTCTSTGRS
jgi:hypothetical protein